MLMAQATDTLQLLRDVGSGPCVKGGHDVRARGLPQFPITLDLRTGAELCCISSGITALRKIHAIYIDIWAARNASDRIVRRQTRRNPVLKRCAVSMRAKICGH
jgi:hypothetical protein